MRTASEAVYSENFLVHAGNHVFFHGRIDLIVQFYEKSIKFVLNQIIIFKVYYFWQTTIKIVMKKIYVPIMALAGVFALYEQSKPHPNVYIMILAIIIFMYGMMRLTAKVPSKNQDNSDDDVS